MLAQVCSVDMIISSLHSAPFHLRQVCNSFIYLVFFLLHEKWTKPENLRKLEMCPKETDAPNWKT